MKPAFLRQWSAALTTALSGPKASVAKPYLRKTTPRHRHQVVEAMTYRGVLYLR